ncbi:hypothetical protein LEMLEM_LOCUS24777, partial [Lemmus lemmus]
MLALFPLPQVLWTRTLGCGHIWRQYLCRCNCSISSDLFKEGLKPNDCCSWGPAEDTEVHW